MNKGQIKPAYNSKHCSEHKKAMPLIISETKKRH